MTERFQSLALVSPQLLFSTIAQDSRGRNMIIPEKLESLHSIDSQLYQFEFPLRWFLIQKKTSSFFLIPSLKGGLGRMFSFLFFSFLSFYVGAICCKNMRCCIQYRALCIQYSWFVQHHFHEYLLTFATADSFSSNFAGGAFAYRHGRFRKQANTLNLLRFGTQYTEYRIIENKTLTLSNLPLSK